MNLANRIKRLRVEKGLISADVCRGIISPSHYSNIENGRYAPATDTLLLLADRLSVPKDYFINVYEDSTGMDELLNKLEQKLEAGDTQEVSSFLNAQKDNFRFIPSIRQELFFNMLNYLVMITSNKKNQAQELYREKISWINNEYSRFGVQVQLKYFHVSGLHFYFQKDYEESIYFFKKVLEINESPQLQAKISLNIALAFTNQYQYQKALEYVEIANNLYLHLHDWERTGTCYNLKAMLLRERNLLSESERYIKKGFSISESTELHARLYHNLSLINKDRGNYYEALENLNESIRLKESDNQLDIFVSYRAKLNLLLLMEDILALKKLLPVAYNCIEMKIDEAHYLFIQAKMDYLLEDFTKYEKSIVKSINIFLTEEAWKDLKIASEHYAIFLEENTKYKKALEHQKICMLALKNIYRER